MLRGSEALDCATSLGLKLQKYNITKDVYSLWHISLKDFSLQGWSLHRICCGSSPRCIFDGYGDALTILVRS
ncbi:hypothetical protein V6N13_023282 [Hibiscus sabdariffa]